MIGREHPQLSIRKQTWMLGVNRNRLEPKERISEEDRAIMRDLDELHTRRPVYGQRKLAVELRKLGWKIGRKRPRRLMEIMGIAAVAPDEVWCADITYMPMGRGFAYLVVIMDRKSRAVLSWRISNTADTRFCLEALAEAVRIAGRVPGIFN